MAGRPSADSMADTDKYARLADSQVSVINQIATIAPLVLPHVVTQMTTADSGATFQYGTDGNGYPIFPVGNASIYPSLQAIPDYPWIPNVEYLDEGTQIRMPNGRLWSGTLYWYGISPVVSQPLPISATNAPVLQPVGARILIVIDAVKKYAEEFNRNPALAATMQAQWTQEFGQWLTQMRRHIRGVRPRAGLLGTYAAYPGGGIVWNGFN